ncbi:hypothetical protein PENSPDRAFT_733025 [Peniophora sp. CONT]|nr:hypothetical protein PENSPDRAFT_733025 [Peniophora sp. CONT]
MSPAGSSATPSLEPEKKASKKPAKRAKTKKTDDAALTKAPSKRLRKQGRLSVLPTLPMDVLYEIFAHIGPADLLHLARTTKSFRGILISRQSAFLWRSVLDAGSDEARYPPRPEDMSEPAWTNLLFGGGKCAMCGSQTSKEILWAIRKRLCKACQSDHLVRSYVHERPDWMDSKIKWSDILPADPGRQLERHIDVGRTCYLIFRPDAVAYVDEMNALRIDAGPDFFTLRSQLDEERKKKMLIRYKHANACYKSEDARSANRADELGDLKKVRFEEIKTRLLELGYDAADINSREFKRHPEVRAPKPVTNRTWTRLGPIVRQVVEGIRDRRLASHRAQRMEKRQDAIEDEYNDAVVRALPWAMVAFVPYLRRVWEKPGFEDVKALMEHDDANPSPEYRASIRQTLISSIPKVQQAILYEVENLRTAVPQAWATTILSPPPTALSHTFAKSEYTLDLTSLAPLDRAAFVFRCQNPTTGRTRPIHFGLDAIAHGCSRHVQSTPVEPEDDLRSLMVQILGLLALDPATATPLDIDQLAPVLVCTHGHAPTPGSYATGVAFTNWRDAVAHGDTRRVSPDHKTGQPVFRLASAIEARYVRASATIRSKQPTAALGSSRNMLGCCHCSDHLKFRGHAHFSFLRHAQAWMNMLEIKDHLLVSHNIDDGVEGRDYYYDRRTPVVRFEHKMYEETSSTTAFQRSFAGPIRLPAVSVEQLETQVVAKEALAAAIDIAWSSSKKPAKRAKTKKTSDSTTNKTPAKRRGKQGRLSVLPTLPLDLLYEIFDHLGPLDLLNLARMTKGFRNILMSRQSAFLWRAVLDTAASEAGYPPRPEDMDEPAWTNLVFGGGVCGLCGSKTPKEILWAIRIRLCKSCRKENLVREDALERPRGMHPMTKWTDIVPSDPTSDLDRTFTDRSYNLMFKEDMVAFIDELNALRSADGHFTTQCSQLEEGRKAKMFARYKHADRCYKAEDARTESRADQLSDLRKTRFEQLKTRLLGLGYAAADLESYDFRLHPEVNVPKPITDRIWTRVGPIVCRVVEEVRDHRLAAERARRLKRRQDAVEVEYNNTFQRVLPWSLVVFAPDLPCVWKSPGFGGEIQAILEQEDAESSLEFCSSIRQALVSAVPRLQRSIMDAADELKAALPTDWTTNPRSTTPTTLSYRFANSESTLDLSPLEPLDRVAFVFRCRSSDNENRTPPVHFGLDTITHRPSHSHEHPLKPEEGLRSLVLQMLELLDLDPATTTPLEVDLLAPIFVCTVDHPALGTNVAGLAFTNWRDAVAHGDTSRVLAEHDSDTQLQYRLASELEVRYVRAFSIQRLRRIWGCCHCTEHLEFKTDGFYKYIRHAQAWKTMPEIKIHLRDVHAVNDGVEGMDYYYNRRQPAARFEHRAYDESPAAYGYAAPGPIHLPDLPADELETQVLAKEAAITEPNAS